MFCIVLGAPPELFFMDSTSAQDLVQILQGEFHGQENSLMRKLHLFCHLASLMGLNGSNC